MKQGGRFPVVGRHPMRDNDLDMTAVERERSAVLQSVRRGALTLEQATGVLHLSYRQAKRIWKRYLAEGDGGLVHRNRGKPSNRAFPDAFKAEVLRRYREQGNGAGPVRFTELLERAGISIDHETLRRWLLENGLWTPRRCRRPRAPIVRPEAGFGEVLSLASRRGPWLGAHRSDGFLLCLVDEATGISLLALASEESCFAAMRLLWAWVDRYGIPAAMRCPRRFTAEEMRNPSLEQQLAGDEPRTAFFASCERLGIETRALHTVQEKKRLADLSPVLEAARDGLRRRGCTAPQEATLALQRELGAELNGRFAAGPRPHHDCHVPIMDRTDLRTVFCTRHERPVRPGLVVEHDRRRFRLERRLGDGPWPVHRVVVAEWLDGSIHVMLGASELPYRELEPVFPAMAYRAI